MKNFWTELPKPFCALAPMEAVTDIVFRHVVAAAARPDIFFTEFVNASSFCSAKGVHSTRDRLAFTADEQPIVAQIWGNKPEQFEVMAKSLAEQGFAGIDINMGCPDKSVVKNGSGSGLIRTPQLACQLIASAKTSGLPISVKTRIGDYKPDEWHDWIKLLLQQDLVNLTVHLRTRKEMTKVPAHYELIPEIIALRDEIAPRTLITINGDIRDRQHGLELAKQYGIDGCMIGRGVFNNPFAFEPTPKQHDRAELVALANLQLDLHDKYSTKLSPRKYDPLKRYFKIYFHGFPGASGMRDKLMHTKNTDEAREIIGERNA
ncbi:MAG: tRNA-dihydrouridine synthase [Candidatus Saccharibacteria bacterium]